LLDESNQYRANNKDKVKVNKAASYQRNREAILVKHAEYREANREKLRESYRRHYQENRERRLEQGKEYQKSEKGKAASYRATLKQIKKHPDRVKARSAINKGVSRGKIQKPSDCQSCGATGRIEAHHHNGYAKENHLDVVWLCKSCHLIEHRKGNAYV